MERWRGRIVANTSKGSAIINPIDNVTDKTTWAAAFKLWPMFTKIELIKTKSLIQPQSGN